MGRKKKSANISYVDIVASTYMKQSEYERAQVMFSAAIDSNGEGEDCDDDDSDGGFTNFQQQNNDFFL